MKNPKFKDNILKRGNRILGYVRDTKNEGFAYFIGKPSDYSVARFTGTSPLTEEQARERLFNACNVSI